MLQCRRRLQRDCGILHHGDQLAVLAGVLNEDRELTVEKFVSDFRVAVVIQFGDFTSEALPLCQFTISAQIHICRIASNFQPEIGSCLECIRVGQKFVIHGDVRNRKP